MRKMRAILLRIQILASQGFVVAMPKQVKWMLQECVWNSIDASQLDKTIGAAKFTARLAPQSSNNLFQQNTRNDLK